MATPLVLTSCRIFSGGLDLTGYSNKTSFEAEVEERDVTTFLPSTDADVGWKKVKAGLASAKVVGGGHRDITFATQDELTWTNLATVIPHSVYPVDAEVASLGYFTSVLAKSYTFGGAVGDVDAWSIDDSSAWPVVRAQSLHPPGTARIASGNGTAVQIGTVSATQKIYAALHVLSVSGTAAPTITVKVQSDNAQGFGSATDQITFTAATATGGQISRTAGAITDDWWRVSWTITGTNPSFLFVVSAGIAV